MRCRSDEFEAYSIHKLTSISKIYNGIFKSALLNLYRLEINDSCFYDLSLKWEWKETTEMSFRRFQSILVAQTYHRFSSVKWQTKLDSSQALSTRIRQFLPSYVSLCIHKNPKSMSYCWDDQERLNIIFNRIMKNEHVEQKATKGWFVDNATSNP